MKPTHYPPLAILLAAFFINLLPNPALAGGPPADPILRIETGMHTAQISRIGVDAKERILVTASADKTARVWDLETGRLRKILRVPADTGKDGRLYAVAISPDGKTVAAGGWTGYAWDGKNSIYLFNLETGAVTRRITGLSNVILHLAFSKDGRYLAATIGESNGLRVYETKNWSLKAEDTDYGNNSYWADFDRTGRLVTVSYDGFLRLYDRKFRLIAKKKAPGGKRPFSACFSPDGKNIAVGFSDSTKVNVLSGTDLSLLYSPDTDGVDNGTIESVAWSSDGSFLYAGGMWNDSGTIPIRRWSRKGRGNYTDLPASPMTIMHILPLKDGGVVFGASDPAFGIFDRRGRRTLFRGPSIADHRENDKGFLISEDGDTVRFGFEVWGKRPAIFSVSSRTLSLSEKKTDLLAPVTEAGGLSVTGWEDTRSPELNGKPLDLEQYERSRSLAISPDRKRFLLGTEWYLRLFDRNGDLQWKVPVQGIAWGVNISGDGKVAVAALGDGTIRWYRMSDGNPLLTLFPHKDGKRWVLWTPSGYYAASANSDELIGWHINNGKDKTPDFFPASKFRSVYYRPDVIAKVLSAGDEGEAIRLADGESGRRRQEIEIKKMVPPVVTLLSPQDMTEISDPNLTLRYAVRTPSGEPVTDVRVLADGRPISRERGIRRKKDRKDAKTYDVQIKVPERDCEVSVIAENRYAASEPATVQLLWRSKKQEEFVIKPKLYVLAVGVGKYRNPDLRLGFPAKDAEDFAAVLKKQEGKLYRDVVPKILTDENAAKDDVLDGLEWIERQTTSKDVAMVFMAGHGVNDRNGNYYFLPGNADPDRLKRTGVPYSTIRDTVSGLPGKVLFFVDTCHSGNIMGSKRRGDMADIDKVVNDLASAENGVVVFASSTGRQYSLENPAWGNGAFTKALVEGLSGKADYTGKKKITINMLDLYLSERVKELTNGQQTPTTAKPRTVPDFPVALR
ncbi:caspase family protein [Desulfococcaceae bacterium HSG8]|nr:caspase family protein [Desulfococcaceae bacterium HSG8]